MEEKPWLKHASENEVVNIHCFPRCLLIKGTGRGWQLSEYHVSSNRNGCGGKPLVKQRAEKDVFDRSTRRDPVYTWRGGAVGETGV